MTESLPVHPKQSPVIVYSKDYCPYCTAAKNLLTQRGVGFREVDITNDKALQEEMYQRSAPRKTVPQVFIADAPVGGFTDLKKLDEEGRLEKLLFPSGR